MKAIIAIVTLGVCVSVFGINVEPPTNLNAFNGRILASLAERGNFQFKPGTLSSCTRDQASDIVVHHCQTQDATFLVTGFKQVSATLKFNDMTIYSFRAEDGTINQRYFFRGTYSENPISFPLETTASVSFINTKSSPNKVAGILKLEDLGITATLVPDAE